GAKRERSRRSRGDRALQQTRVPEARRRGCGRGGDGRRRRRGGGRAARSGGVATAPTTFGRLFPDLPPFAADTDSVKSALRSLGAKGGLLDAQDNIGAGPIALITDPALNMNNPNNPTHTAGTHFVGQFVDHDITFDASSPLGVPTDPNRSTNSRTASLDLDSLYGAGPVASAQMYQP